MRKDKDLAFKLRRSGWSYFEISRRLGIPKTTLADWFKNEKWSQQLKENLTQYNHEWSRSWCSQMGRRRSREYQRLYKQARREAKETFKNNMRDPLFSAGLGIYWGEGDNKIKNGSVCVGNTDPFMIRLFFQFIKKYFPVLSNRVKLYLILYPDLDDLACKKYWSKIVGLPFSRFNTSTYIKGRHPTKRLSHGICQIRIGSRQHKEMLGVWIKLLKNFTIQR